MATIASARTSAEAKRNPACGTRISEVMFGNVSPPALANCTAGMMSPSREDADRMMLQKAGLTRRAGCSARPPESARSPAASACRPPTIPARRFRIRRLPAPRTSSTMPASSLRRRSRRTSRSARSTKRRGRAHSRRARPRRARRAGRSSPAPRAIRWAARASPANGTVATLDQQWLEAGHGAQDLSRRRRRALVDGDREARRDRLLAGRHAVQQRLRRGQHVLGQRARLAGAVQRLRQHGARDHDAAGGRHARDVLAHRERRSVPARDGRLRPVRRHHRARARHGAERAARADASRR